MNNVRQSLSGPAGTFVKVVMIILAFYILYIVYQFIYSKETRNDNVVVKGVNLARPAGATDSAQVFTTTTETKIPKLANGQDFCIEYWMYISDTTYRPNNNKFILSLGGPITGGSASNPAGTTAAEQALLVYLTGYNYGLAVRTNAVRPATPTPVSPLAGTAVTSTFATAAQVASASSELIPCDIASIDLQKWVHVGIVSYGKTLDVYIDGKLARSCILPSTINLMTTHQMNVFAFGGFGGYVSNVTTHDYALNPEQMWRIYMAGPGPAYTFWEQFKALFDPKSIGTLTYPKYPSPPS
jgi:hypothetical protein